MSFSPPAISYWTQWKVRIFITMIVVAFMQCGDKGKKGNEKKYISTPSSKIKNPPKELPPPPKKSLPKEKELVQEESEQRSSTSDSWELSNDRSDKTSVTSITGSNPKEQEKEEEETENIDNEEEDPIEESVLHDEEELPKDEVEEESNEQQEEELVADLKEIGLLIGVPMNTVDNPIKSIETKLVQTEDLFAILEVEEKLKKLYPKYKKSKRYQSVLDVTQATKAGLEHRISINQLNVLAELDKKLFSKDGQPLASMQEFSEKVNGLCQKKIKYYKRSSNQQWVEHINTLREIYEVLKRILKVTKNPKDWIYINRAVKLIRKQLALARLESYKKKGKRRVHFRFARMDMRNYHVLTSVSDIMQAIIDITYSRRKRKAKKTVARFKHTWLKVMKGMIKGDYTTPEEKECLKNALERLQTFIEQENVVSYKD